MDEGEGVESEPSSPPSLPPSLPSPEPPVGVAKAVLVRVVPEPGVPALDEPGVVAVAGVEVGWELVMW